MDVMEYFQASGRLQYYFLQIIYLIASISFIVGLKMLSNPKSARRGNWIAGFGMTLAIFATIFFHREAVTDQAGNRLFLGGIHNLGWIFGGLIIGTIIGVWMALKVKMTAMPQMVSFFNGMGGACAALISLLEYQKMAANTEEVLIIPQLNIQISTAAGNGQVGPILVILLGLMIGSISFAGSMIAYGKLEGKIKDRKVPFQQIINIVILLVIVVIAVLMMGASEPQPFLLYVVLVLSLIYGVLFVMPIGGADMPVVISLLNSFTGIAAAFGGFLYDNKVMLTGGILVGSAGTILTILMCRAMNRSLVNVLVGALGGSGGGGTSTAGDTAVQEAQPTDVAILCSYAKKVVIVPGYGLAVAQAQHVCHEMEQLLEAKGVEVKYAIHPVAGRMPGHMNVLLAEADVPYDKMMEMEAINPQFITTDVVLVIGANDVVNPAAKNDSASPIYGMPVLDVEKAKQVIILKRSMRSGYAGIENELFFYQNTKMLFGDAKASIEQLIHEIKDL